MADVSVNFDLGDVPLALYPALARALNRVGQHAAREAKANAPRSPTVGQISKTLVRKRRTRQRAFPGGLEKSIQYSVERGSKGVEAHVFVAANSPAGKYADYIHNQKRVRWWKRGVGTVRKGARADEKFIERAVGDNLDAYGKLIDEAVAQACAGGR